MTNPKEYIWIDESTKQETILIEKFYYDQLKLQNITQSESIEDLVTQLEELQHKYSQITSDLLKEMEITTNLKQELDKYKKEVG